MNHTFMDAVKGKREAHINEIQDDRDDDDDDDRDDDAGDGGDRQAGKYPRRRQERGAVDGEEDDCGEMYNDNGDQMTAFNLKDEREGGHFDENMNYIFHKEKGESDAWLANMDEVTMEKSIGETVSAIARQKKLQEDKERSARESSQYDTMGKSVVELKVEILNLMIAGERVSDAMRRLKVDTTTQSRPGQGRSRPNASVTSTTTAANKTELNKLMTIADELLSRESLTGIYEMSYEALEASATLWEYLDASGTIQGPFTSTQLSEWKKMGYFTGESVVMIRKVPFSDKKRPNPTSNSRSAGGSRKGVKRVKFDVGNKSSHDDLVNDLDDDDDDDDDGVDDAAAATLEEEEKEKKASTGWTAGGWVSSDSIDFGDGGKIEASANIDVDDNDDDDNDGDGEEDYADGGDDSD